jgi:hypothetical protein
MTMLVIRSHDGIGGRVGCAAISHFLLQPKPFGAPRRLAMIRTRRRGSHGISAWRDPRTELTSKRSPSSGRHLLP